jgi:hypothetical protein
MPTVIINNFGGGHAEDLRTFATNQSEYSLNFDVFTNEHYLQPFPNTVAETVTAGTMNDHRISDVIDGISLSGDGYIGLGQAGSADTNLKFFSKSGATYAWTKRVEDTAGSVINGTLVAYKSLAYALKIQGSDVQLLELTDASTITSRGTVTGETTACKPFVHPEDNILYGGAGDQLWKWDGSSFTSYSSIFPTGTTITSLTDYGTYLVVAIRTLEGKAIAYLWGRDGTLTTTQGIISFGKGNLNTIENLGEIIVGVVTPNFTTTINDKILIKTWAGGEVRTIKEITVGTTGTTNSILKAKSKDKLYFIIGNNDCIYVLGKNKSGEWVANKDRYVDNGTAPSAVMGLSIIDDFMWIGYTNAGGSTVFYRTEENSYTSTDVYRTSINPSMPIADRYKDKQLKAVRLSYTGASTGTTVLKYSVDGSTMTTLISDTNTTGEKTTNATNEYTDSLPLLTGKEFQFQIECTGGTKIKEIAYKYENLNEIM